MNWVGKVKSRRPFQDEGGANDTVTVVYHGPTAPPSPARP